MFQAGGKAGAPNTHRPPGKALGRHAHELGGAGQAEIVFVSWRHIFYQSFLLNLNWKSVMGGSQKNCQKKKRRRDDSPRGFCLPPRQQLQFHLPFMHLHEESAKAALLMRPFSTRCHVNEQTKSNKSALLTHFSTLNECRCPLEHCEIP